MACRENKAGKFLRVPGSAVPLRRKGRAFFTALEFLIPNDPARNKMLAFPADMV